MVRYRRNFVPGGKFFFTVKLVDRRSSALVDHVDALRQAFRIARAEQPFNIETIVVLPEHLHTVMTLPPSDADFSGRWHRIKSFFTRQAVTSGVPIEPDRRGEYELWQRRFWEHTIRNDDVMRVCDWPYSSFHRYVRLGWLPEDWAGVVDGPGIDVGERG